MNIRFKATECGTQTTGRVVMVGASNSKSKDEYHYIAMQALLDSKTEQEKAIHFEIDDQINGNYDLLKSCECTPNALLVHLSKGVRWYPELRSVEVDLAGAKVHYSELVAGLRQVFENCPNRLTIAAELDASPNRRPARQVRARTPRKGGGR
jgi:hypothetical protein